MFVAIHSCDDDPYALCFVRVHKIDLQNGAASFCANRPGFPDRDRNAAGLGRVPAGLDLPNFHTELSLRVRTGDTFEKYAQGFMIQRGIQLELQQIDPVAGWDRTLNGCVCVWRDGVNFGIGRRI